MVENGGKSKGEILEKAWYSEAVISTPDKVFWSKAIINALEDAWLTDEFLSKKHLELIQAHTIAKMPFPAWTEPEIMKKELEENVPWARYISFDPVINQDWDEYMRYAKFSVPDRLTQDKALDKAYKIKWSYAPEKHDVDVKVSLLSLFKK